jgi:hypothetical protein
MEEHDTRVEGEDLLTYQGIELEEEEERERRVSIEGETGYQFASDVFGTPLLCFVVLSSPECSCLHTDELGVSAEVPVLFSTQGW